MILISAIILVAVLWFWHRWSHRRIYHFGSRVATIPYCPPLPVIGQLYIILAGFDEIMRKIVDAFFCKVLNEFNIVCIWLPTPCFLFKGISNIQKILHNPTVVRSDSFKLVSCFLGDGLIGSCDKIGRIKRSFYLPVFKTQNIDALMPRLNKNCLNLVIKLSEHVGSDPVDLFPIILRTALKSVCNIMYGGELDFDCESDDFKKLEHAVMRIPDIGVERQCRPWLKPELIFNFVYKKEIEHILDTFKTFNNKSIKEAKARRSKRPIDTTADDFVNVNRSEQEFSHFLKAFNDLQNERPDIVHENSLIHELITFCSAGTDTSAVALTSSLFLLGHYPHVQEKLFNEIASVVGMTNDVTAEDLDKMAYLNIVCKEVLRWSSPIGLVSRKTTNDINLSSCTVPPGCNIYLSIVGLHNDPKTFPEPRKFDPDRFLPENRQGCNPYDFLPFGSGPRYCIGKTYSTLLMKVAIIQVLRSFKIASTMDIDSIKWKYAIVLMSSDGYPVQLQRRSAC